MEIKLPHMPFKFDSPEGRMEVTVRPSPSHADGMPDPTFAAAVTFHQPGLRALERIPLATKSDTYSGALHVLTEGFKVNPGAHEAHTVEFRVLTALCHAEGVVDLNA